MDSSALCPFHFSIKLCALEHAVFMQLRPVRVCVVGGHVTLRLKRRVWLVISGSSWLSKVLLFNRQIRDSPSQVSGQRADHDVLR